MKRLYGTGDERWQSDIVFAVGHREEEEEAGALLMRDGTSRLE